MEAQKENEQFKLEIDQQLSSSSGQMLVAQQENELLKVDNDRLRRIVEELQAKVDEISGDFVTEVTLKEGCGRRSTMLRNEGNLQVCIILTAIKNAPLCVPRHPVLDKVWDLNMEYISQKAECNVRDEIEHRVPTAPLKDPDLAIFLTKGNQGVQVHCLDGREERAFVRIRLRGVKSRPVAARGTARLIPQWKGGRRKCAGVHGEVPQHHRSV